MNRSTCNVFNALVLALSFALLVGCGGGKDGGTDGTKDAAKDAKKDSTKDTKKDDSKDAAKDSTPKTKDSSAKADTGVSLFDGKTLGSWKATAFGGEGDVEIEDGNLVLTMGEPLTGVTWQGDLPAKINYEINLEAQRAQGTDFFLGLTVPVKDKAISLVLGGWGGGVCGLSSLDSFDASENDTTQYINFKNEQWYKVRMQVLDNAINVWLDGKQIVECDITGRNISIRPEVELSTPMGICTFQTIGKFRNITMKKIDPPAAKKTD